MRLEYKIKDNCLIIQLLTPHDQGCYLDSEIKIPLKELKESKENDVAKEKLSTETIKEHFGDITVEHNKTSINIIQDGDWVVLTKRNAKKLAKSILNSPEGLLEND